MASSEPNDGNVSRVAQTALHDGFAAIADECDLTSEKTLKWIYGLLCMLEKPLLPDQASDLNTLMGKLN